MSQQYHPFHLVDPSPWPFAGASAALGLTLGGVVYMQGYKYGDILMLISLVLVLIVMAIWWRDVIREATFMGYHTLIVQRGLRYGMALFIVSEIMLFFSFFWAFFHSSLGPTIEIGSVWPPVGIHALNPFEVPLLNTAVLLSSGATATWSHHAMISGDRKNALVGLILTILLGVFFTGLQAMEYVEASFTIADSVFGSTFFMATGAHGGHILVGTTFLVVCFFRILQHHFTQHHHAGFEAALWYWHFVDAVWLFLYVFMYWWSAP